MCQPVDISGDEKLVREPGAKNVIRTVRDSTLKREFVVFQVEHGDLTGATVDRAEVNAGDEKQSVALVELRELRVLPVELLHVVAVLFRDWVVGVPDLEERNLF